MAVGGVVLQFRADADKARKDIDKLTRTIKDVGDESNSAGKKMGKLGKVGIAAVAAGAVAGAAALYDFAKAAAKDYQEAGKLTRTLKAIPGITDDMVASNAKWIDSMEIATGMADTDFRNAIARLAVATGDLTKAQDLASLAADVAAGRNQDLANVVPLLEKAYGGNTAALKRQMPWLDANKDGTLTYAEAVKGLTKAYGGAAEAAADSDPWKRIQVVWSQMKEALGQFIIPSLEALGDWFKDKKNQKALQDWITKVGEFSYAIGVELVNYIKTTFIPFVENELIPAVEDVYAWFNSADGKAAIESWGNALSGLGDIIAGVVANLDKLFKGLDKLPGNVILQKLGLIPKFEFGDAGTPKGGYPRTLTQEQATALSSRTGSDKPASKSTINVTVVNGKQEPALDSAALAIRLGKRVPAA